MAIGELYGNMSDEDIKKTIARFKETQSLIKRLKVDEEQFKDIIKSIMTERGLSEYDLGVFRIVYTTVESSRFNLDKFKKEEPELYKQYCEVQLTRPLKII